MCDYVLYIYRMYKNISKNIMVNENQKPPICF